MTGINKLLELSQFAQVGLLVCMVDLEPLLVIRKPGIYLISCYTLSTENGGRRGRVPSVSQAVISWQLL